MPSDTFFRLPEEKQARLITAAWEEFTKVPYMEASINKIVCRARIPRGSFYQYFTDKEDLFLYLLDTVKDHVIQRTQGALEDRQADLFSFPTLMFRELLRENVLRDEKVTTAMKVLTINPKLDLHQLCFGGSDLLDGILARTDRTMFRDQSRLYLQQVLELVVFALGRAILGTLGQPETAAEQEQKLNIKVEIIRSGCCRESIIQTGGTSC